MLSKNPLVFLHLLAMAVAVGKMLEYDARFLRLAAIPPTPERQSALVHTKAVMNWSLLVLWLTGLALVAWGRYESAGYLNNPKLWIKVATVCCLTLNGWLMHRLAFPLLQRGDAFLDLPLRQAMGLTCFAAISSVSWLYASFLGIARSWNHSARLSDMLTLYLALLIAAAAGGGLLIAALHARHRRNKEAGGQNAEYQLHAG